MLRTDHTLTLRDLLQWSEPGTHLAVLGHPIQHSLSPVMHNAALKLMACANPRFNEWHYWKFDVAPDELPLALERFCNIGFRGINLTVPHKVAATMLVPSIESSAKEIGALNTLRLTNTGYEGFNTDGHGLVAGLAEDLQVNCRNTNVVLLGAGGAARGAAVELLRGGCRSLWIGNRSEGSLRQMLASIQSTAGDIPINPFVFPAIPAGIPSGTVVINSTAVGLKNQEGAPIDLHSFPRPAAVYDMIYNPPRTPLLLDAASLGIPSANGLSMLVHQGAKALELWTGERIPVAAMREAAQAHLSTLQ